jgi:hypothetical protein
MTARAGDALSHAIFGRYFKPPSDRFSDSISERISCPDLATRDVGRDRLVSCKLIGSARICMGAMSHLGGLKRPVHLLLAPTSQQHSKTVFVSTLQ